jgi:hypothetical protein
VLCFGRESDVDFGFSMSGFSLCSELDFRLGAAAPAALRQFKMKFKIKAKPPFPHFNLNFQQTLAAPPPARQLPN